MDIHKPKPWHGWPEFLKEIGTIVIGVLIALAFEQGVEWLHWRDVREQTEANLRVGANNGLVAAIARIATLPCVNARTVELTKALAANETSWRGTTVPILAGVAKPALPQVIREPKGNYARTAWDIAVAQGAVLHMPAETESLFARVYRNSAQIEALENVEGDLETRLGLLAYDRQLSREQRDGFMTLLSQLDSTETRIASANLRLMNDVRQLKMKRPPGVDAEIARLRSIRGACVRDVAYPGT
jgi:hypothetical protein